MKPQNFDEIVNFRRSVRVYDSSATFDESVVERALTRALLAPTSSNLQLFEIYRVKSPDKKSELARHCLSQPAATTANELIVFVVRRDLWSERAQFNHEVLAGRFGPELTKVQKLSLAYYSKVMPLVYGTDPFGVLGAFKKLFFSLIGLVRPVYRQVSLADNRITAHKSSALVAQTFMLAMASEGYDTCPMEGIDTTRVRKFLGLPCSAEINMVVSVGIRKPEGVYGERYRLELAQLVKTV